MHLIHTDFMGVCILKKKISVSITIFILLFSGAWGLNLKERKEFYDPEAKEDVVDILPSQMGTEYKKTPIKIFKSREYVRIEQSFGE